MIRLESQGSSITTGNLTASGRLSVTGGTGAVVGAGAALSLTLATTGHAGLLDAPTLASGYMYFDGSVLSWNTASGTGDTSGPASSTDNAIARFDSTTGKVIQNSALILADLASNNVNVNPPTVSGTPTSVTLASGASSSNVDGANLILKSGAAGGSGAFGGDILLQPGAGGTYGGRVRIPQGKFTSNTDMNCGLLFDFAGMSSSSQHGMMWFEDTLAGVETWTFISHNRQLLQLNYESLTGKRSVNIVGDAFYPDAGNNGLTELGRDAAYWGITRSGRYRFGNSNASIDNDRSLFLKSGQYTSFGIGFDNRASHGNEVYFQGQDQGDSTYKEFLKFSIASSVSKIDTPSSTALALSAAGTTKLTMKASGIINAVLPSYADDAAAGAGGLVSGDLYQVTGVGTVTAKQ